MKDLLFRFGQIGLAAVILASFGCGSGETPKSSTDQKPTPKQIEKEQSPGKFGGAGKSK